MLKKLSRKLKNKREGFSLIEVLVAIVILGIVVGPVCTGIVTSVAVNRTADEMLQGRLAVSSAVETLMAQGIRYDVADPDTLLDPSSFEWDSSKEYFIVNGSSVRLTRTCTAVEDDDGKPVYYKVTVSEYREVGNDETRKAISVSTKIQAVPVNKAELGGE